MAPSAPLLWQITRDNSAQLYKQKNAPTFNKASLSGLNQYKYCNALAPVQISVKRSGEKKDVVTLVTRKSGAKSTLSKAASVKTGLKKNSKKGKSIFDINTTVMLLHYMLNRWHAQSHAKTFGRKQRLEYFFH